MNERHLAIVLVLFLLGWRADPASARGREMAGDLQRPGHLAGPRISQVKLIATNAVSVVLPDTGHWILDERPQERADVLMRFVESRD